MQLMVDLMGYGHPGKGKAAGKAVPWEGSTLACPLSEQEHLQTERVPSEHRGAQSHLGAQGPFLPMACTFSAPGPTEGS